MNAQPLYTEVKLKVEALLFSREEPLSLELLSKLIFDDNSGDKADKEGSKELYNLCQSLVIKALDELEQQYQTHCFELVQVGGGYTIQIPHTYHIKGTDKEVRPSKAWFETLAIIAYHQPITRGEIEAIRGVSTSSHTIRDLLERGLVMMKGHRQSPGRPALFATTDLFLKHFQLNHLNELPTLESIETKLEQAGLLPQSNT